MTAGGDNSLYLRRASEKRRPVLDQPPYFGCTSRGEDTHSEQQDRG